MRQLRYILLVASAALILLFNASLLDFLGWKYTEGSGSIITKIHPAFYTLLLLAVIQLFYGGRAVWRTALSPTYIFFIFAALMLLVRAVLIVQSGITEGEFTAVVVTWLIPALLIIGLIGQSRETLMEWGTPVRLFFLFNSLMGLTERLIGHRFIPGLIDNAGFLDHRAAGMLAHPLNASMLTGIMIVILVSARPGKTPAWMRVPEIALHIAAMFAFGGRAALVFTAATVILSGLFAWQAKSETRLGLFQRLLPYIVILGGFILVSLPIEFVDATLDRFTNDTQSSETRNSAVQMLGMLDLNELLWGINANRRSILMDFFGSRHGIEISWIALAMSYGLAVTLPMLLALPMLLLKFARQLDRSAFYGAILFLAVTAGSLSIGSKSLLISQFLVMIVALSQKRHRDSLMLRDYSSPKDREIADPPVVAQGGDLPTFLQRNGN